MAGRLRKRLTLCKVFACVYFFAVSAVGPWFCLWHQMLLITALTDEGTPPLPWLLLLDFCLRSWSSWEAFSLRRTCVKAEQAVILGAYRGYGVGCLLSVSVKLDSYVIQLGSWVTWGEPSWGAVQQKPFAGQHAPCSWAELPDLHCCSPSHRRENSGPFLNSL